MFGKHIQKQETAPISQPGKASCDIDKLNQMLSSSRNLALSLQKQIVAASNVISQARSQHESVEKFYARLKQSVNSLNDINSAVQEINQVIANQKQSAVNTSESVEHIETSVSTVADIVKQRAEVTKELTVSATDGAEKVHQVLGVIENLSKNVGAINEVISSINTLSEQTNLLAMNASIEAVHAGKAGLGFSVVAAEIRKLSENTRKNAATIAGTLNTMIETLNTVRSTADAAGSAMQKINTRVTEAADSYQQIADDMQRIVQNGREILDTSVSFASSSAQMSERSVDIATRINSITEDMKHIEELTGALDTKADQINSSTANQMFMMNEIIACADEIESNARTGLTTNTFSYTGIVLKHLRWVTRVRAAIDGKLNGQEIALGDHHSCDLGKWIDTVNTPAIRSMEEYTKLSSEHQLLHEQVRKIFSEIGKADADTLEADYNRILDLSGNVITQLTKIRDKIGASAM